jgi:hypothetical protein
MRIPALLFLLSTLPISAATLRVQVDRNGFAGLIEVAVAPREEGRLPSWSATKTLAAKTPAVQFDGLAPGMYTVLARGAQPLQRLSAKANVGATGTTLRLTIPKTSAALRVTLGAEPLAGASVTLTHDELRWDTELTTDGEGRFAGALWEPGAYDARVRRDDAAAPHVADIELDAKPLTIDVPDRHVTGHVTDDQGRPIAGALVTLRTDGSGWSLNVRTRSAPDGRFEFFGVKEGQHSLLATAPSYLQSDAALFALEGGAATHPVDLKLSRGALRAVRVVDGRGQALANAEVFTACDGHVKSTTTTNADGRAKVAIPDSGRCAVYALPKEGSIGVAAVDGAGEAVVRVPAGSASLKLTLTSEAGESFADVWLLMRIDGVVVPPAIVRHLTTRGFSLVTDTEGRISLDRIPSGTYEFWPYRTQAEGEMIYEISEGFAAPIAVNVVTGENDATVKFKARR